MYFERIYLFQAQCGNRLFMGGNGRYGALYKRYLYLCRRGFLRFSGSGGIGNDVIGACDAQTCDALRGVEMGASAEIDEVSALVDLSGNREGKRLEWEQTISK